MLTLSTYIGPRRNIVVFSGMSQGAVVFRVLILDSHPLPAMHCRDPIKPAVFPKANNHTNGISPIDASEVVIDRR